MELAERAHRARGYSRGWADSHRHPGVLLYDLECVCICLGLMVTTGFLLPLAREPISSIPVRGWRHGNQARGSLFPYLLPQPLVDGRTLKILNLCARICSVPWWGTEVCPYPGPDRSHLEWEWQQLCLRCHRLCAWPQPYPSSWSGPCVGEEWQQLQIRIEWGRLAGMDRSWRTGPKEVHPRKIGLCRNQMFFPIIPSFYLMDFLFCSCHKELTQT